VHFSSFSPIVLVAVTKARWLSCARAFKLCIGGEFSQRANEIYDMNLISPPRDFIEKTGHQFMDIFMIRGCRPSDREAGIMSPSLGQQSEKFKFGHEIRQIRNIGIGDIRGCAIDWINKESEAVNID
jgi:hypothetical protein